MRWTRGPSVIPFKSILSSVLTVDTVASTATGGTTLVPSGALTSMDASGYDVYTAALASANSVSGGLPSNGYFGANGTQSPAVQLHFSDNSAAPNSVVLNRPAPNDALSLQFAVPPAYYTRLQIYGTLTNGDSTVSITLTYSDTSTATTTLTVPDWGSSSEASGAVFVFVGGLGRLGTQIFEKNYTFVIYGVNVTCSQTKVLTSVNVAVGGGSAAFTFYGATAW